MKKRHTRFVFKYIAGPLVVPVIWLFRSLYNLLFGWFDVRASKAREANLESEIRDILPFLFGSFGGVVVPNIGVPFPEPFNYATVSVACGSLLFRFSRGRGQFSLDIARSKDPSTWHDLCLVLAAINGSTECPERRAISNLNEAAMLLEPNMARLVNAFGTDDDGRVERTLRDLHAADRASMRELEFELNRQLR